MLNLTIVMRARGEEKSSNHFGEVLLLLSVASPGQEGKGNLPSKAQTKKKKKLIPYSIKN